MTTDEEAPLESQLTDRPLSEREAKALSRARGFIEARGFATRRTTPFVLELGAGIGAAAVAIVLSFVVIAHRNAPPSTPAQTPPLSVAPSSSSGVPSPATGPGSAAALAKDGWRQLPQAPIAGRSMPAAVWDGREMLIWGGVAAPQRTQALADGAAYDPATRSWSVLPPSPIAAREAMAFAWTGQYLFIWGGENPSASGGNAIGDGALYDPKTRTWQRLPPAPLQAQFNVQAVWNGTEVVLVSGGYGGPNPEAVAYSPANNTWRSLPPMPLSTAGTAAYMTVVAAGADIYVWEMWAHTQQNGNESTTFSGLTLMTYQEATGQWHTVPTSRTGPQHVVSQALWTGLGLVTPAAEDRSLGSSGPSVPPRNGYLLNLGSDTWTPIPHGPVDGLQATSLWTGAALLAFNTGTTTDSDTPGEAAAWDPASDAWRMLPSAPFTGWDVAAVWAGDRLLMWGEMAPPRRDAGAGSGPQQAIGLQFGP